MSDKDNKQSDAKTAGKTQSVSPLADIYSLLGVTQMTTLEGVRTRFFKLTRKIHRQLLDKPDRHTRDLLLSQLRYMCIAHDILTDPVTRTDYDLRTMGLRAEASGAKSPEEKKPAMALGNRSTLRIGELLTVAGLLESTELDIACDMHKAMPEMQFGRFLVKQGFIEEYQLDAVLYAQRLLRKGLITIVQFQAAMEELESSGVPVIETVIERGYASKSDIDQMEAEENAEQEIAAPVYVMPNLAAKAAPQVEEQKPGLLAKIMDAHNAAAQTTEAAPSALSKLLKMTQTNMSPAIAKDDTSGTYKIVGELPSRENLPANLETGDFDVNAIDLSTIQGKAPEDGGQKKSLSRQAQNSGATQTRMDALQMQSGQISDQPELAEADDDCRYDLATGEQIVDPSLRKTYDKIPALRPENLTQFEVQDRDESTNTGEFAVFEEGQEQSVEESMTEPSLKLSNAVPSWKDQLDWTEPEEEAPKSESEAVDLTDSVHLPAVEPAEGDSPERQRDTDPELNKTKALKEAAQEAGDDALPEPGEPSRSETGELSQYSSDPRRETSDLSDYVKAAEINFELEGDDVRSSRDARYDTGELDREQIMQKLTRPQTDDDDEDDDEDEVFGGGESQTPDILSDDDDEDTLDEVDADEEDDDEDEDEDEDAFRVSASYTQSFSFDDDEDEDERFGRYKHPGLGESARAGNNGDFQAEEDRLDDASRAV